MILAVYYFTGIALGKNLQSYLKHNESTLANFKVTNYRHGIFTSTAELQLYSEVLPVQLPVTLNLKIYHGPITGLFANDHNRAVRFGINYGWITGIVKYNNEDTLALYVQAKYSDSYLGGVTVLENSPALIALTKILSKDFNINFDTDKIQGGGTFYHKEDKLHFDFNLQPEMKNNGENLNNSNGDSNSLKGIDLVIEKYVNSEAIHDTSAILIANTSALSLAGGKYTEPKINLVIKFNFNNLLQRLKSLKPNNINKLNLIDLKDLMLNSYLLIAAKISARQYHAVEGPLAYPNFNYNNYVAKYRIVPSRNSRQLQWLYTMNADTIKTCLANCTSSSFSPVMVEMQGFATKQKLNITNNKSVKDLLLNMAVDTTVRNMHYANYNLQNFVDFQDGFAKYSNQFKLSAILADSNLLINYFSKNNGVRKLLPITLAGLINPIKFSNLQFGFSNLNVKLNDTAINLQQPKVIYSNANDTGQKQDLKLVVNKVTANQPQSTNSEAPSLLSLDNLNISVIPEDAITDFREILSAIYKISFVTENFTLQHKDSANVKFERLNTIVKTKLSNFLAGVALNDLKFDLKALDLAVSSSDSELVLKNYNMAMHCSSEDYVPVSNALPYIFANKPYFASDLQFDWVKLTHAGKKHYVIEINGFNSGLNRENHVGSTTVKLQHLLYDDSTSKLEATDLQSVLKVNKAKLEDKLDVNFDAQITDLALNQQPNYQQLAFEIAVNNIDKSKMLSILTNNTNYQHRLKDFSGKYATDLRKLLFPWLKLLLGDFQLKSKINYTVSTGKVNMQINVDNSAMSDTEFNIFTDPTNEHPEMLLHAKLQADINKPETINNIAGLFPLNYMPFLQRYLPDSTSNNYKFAFMNNQWLINGKNIKQLIETDTSKKSAI